MAAEIETQVVYSPRERFWLAILAAFTFFGLNGAFVYGLLHRAMVETALANPLALAFILEAFVLVGLLAYLLRKWGVSRLPWGWFVVLSLLGGLAFALPVALLGSGHRRTGSGHSGGPLPEA
jgi:peptidoglycan biosynthesis protein MviN/MurJ (putative lipid II flippase)